MAPVGGQDLLNLQFTLVGESRRRGLHFYRHEGRSPFANVIPVGSDLEPNTFNPAYVAQIQDWVQDCTETHDDCHSGTDDYLPTRVLDVQEEGKVLLHNTIPTDSGPYTALSHCWGGVIPIRTLTSTMENLKSGIPVSSLPRTFRDAVSVTRLLGCRYLWIDALCIIQDSKEDWICEASRMADVYGNAFVTLSASASPNSSGGLFRQSLLSQTKATFDLKAPNGDIAQIHARPYLHHSAYIDSNAMSMASASQAPLLTRSWCFQEQILSPRILHFTEHEIIFDCNRGSTCNCNLYSPNRDAVNPTLKGRFQESSRSPHTSIVVAIWWDLLQAYSQKQLTFQPDKLPALAGIASRLSQRAKSLGRYVNGMWEGTLPVDLHWQTHGISEEGTIMRADNAPSWSWISIIGPVRHVSGQPTVHGKDVPDIEILDIGNNEDENGLGNERPPSDDRFASITATTLTIRGRLSANGKALFRPELHNPARDKLGFVLTVPAMQKERHWRPDIIAEVGKAGGEIDVAVLWTLYARSIGGIVLAPVSGREGVYRRLGLLEAPLAREAARSKGVNGDTWGFLDELERRVVKLV